MLKRIFLLTVFVAVLVAGCGPAPMPTPTPGPTPTPAPPQPVEVRPGGFAAYVPVPVDVVPDAPAYIPSLNAVTNADFIAWLNPAQRAMLEANGFVVVPDGHEQIYQIYTNAEDAGFPAFVTTDAVLHAYHILYDYSLRLAEIEHFIADLEQLTQTMLDAGVADYSATTGAVQEAARQNVAFFAVAARLLDADADVPADVRDVVDQELTLIDAHSGIVPSPLFGYLEDYSQYVPRGHYTRNADFERYFRAMMWYGRMAFHLTNPQDPEAALRETRSALLIVRALYANDAAAADVWERIYEPTAFFVGTADDLTAADYAAVADAVYGGLPDPVTLADDALLADFVAAARELRPPAIVGGLVTDQENPEEVTMGFRFMGQRFIPDSYIFQQLVYDEVGLYQGSGEPFTLSPSAAGPIRGFPRGLDVPAVLGSDRALALLTQVGDTDYGGYDTQMAALRAEFAALPQEQWTSNLYWNWLYTLDPLLEEDRAGYPFFMQTQAWADKDLHTWLGSWTELRHDTILYAKQSYTILATSIMPETEEPRGYVEPQPAVYARLAALTAQMEAGLGDRGLLSEEMARKLQQMEELLLALKTMSEQELRGEALTESDYAIIRAVGSTLEDLTTFSTETEEEITSEADDRMALIADVHTDTNTEQVLEEGVGDAFPIYVVVLIDGEQVVTVGGVFSYYEFKHPMSDRLTDEDWQAMSPRPDRPDWTGGFISE
ncbi:MAG: DUF3160 domain-containing protein [Anaerolineae bacterium]|nr:DUF3160 domain-containing protein [Anaerolineae bacterium]